MTNEEFEKIMEFILEQESQFSSDIQKLHESQAELRAAQVRTEQVVVQTGEIVARLNRFISDNRSDNRHDQ